MNLMIIEDHEDVRKMLVIEAERRGWLVLEALNLRDALLWLIEGAPDAILCDGDFPLGDATLCLTLSHRDAWLTAAYRAAKEEVPFALLTGDLATIDKARAIGVDHAFAKPSELKQALDCLFSLWSEMHEAAAEGIRK